MSPERMRNSLVSRVWLLHALYFVIGGIWAVVGRRSFEAITGRKADYWLVRTVGGMLTIVGAVIGMAGLNRRITGETALLAVSSSAVLTLVDVIYVAKRRISPVYLLDAGANSALIAGWLGYEQKRRSG
jgi:4-amino-4-deoxy-L-arabinose transferase-like glycosyltransferase